MARKYYAQKDKNGFPVPGVMMSVDSLSSIPTTANIVAIPAADVAPTGQQVVVPQPKGLRYFVKKDLAGNIIPNSLVASFKKPSVGFWYEFKVVR